MSHLLQAVLAAAAGAVLGYGTHRLNQWLAAHGTDATEPALRLEGLWAPVLDAVILGAFFWRFELSPALLAESVLVVILVQVLVFDARHRLILNRVIYPAIAVALLATPVSPLLQGNLTQRAGSVVVGALAAGGLFYLLVLISRGGIGLGDAKLTFFLGAALGIAPLPDSPVIRSLIYGMGLGGVVAALLLVTRIKSMRDYIPYGPYLCMGAIAEMFIFGAPPGRG